MSHDLEGGPRRWGFWPSGAFDGDGLELGPGHGRRHLVLAR